MKTTILLFLGLITSFAAFAQLPQCTGGTLGYVYFQKDSSIYEYNTITDTAILLNNVTVNPTGAPTSVAQGFAIVPDVNTSTLLYDFTWATTIYNGTNSVYTTYDNLTNVWNNSTTTIQSGAVNLTSACTGSLFSYSGTTGLYHAPGLSSVASSTPIVPNVQSSTSGVNSIFDIVGDVDGNVYLLVTKNGSIARGFYKYDPTGSLLQSWNITGIDSTFGAGLAIAGGKIYATQNTAFWIGTLSGNTINFVLNSPGVKGIIGQPGDCATCPNIPPFGGTATMLQANCSVIPTAVSNFQNDFEISSISPNPATNRISVNVNSHSIDDLNVSILSMSGQQLHSQNWKVATGVNRLDMEGLDFAPGIYFIRLINKENKKLVHKVIFN